MCDNGKPEAVCERQGLPLDVLVQGARCVTTLLDSAIPVSPLQVEQPLAECFLCVDVVVVGVVLLSYRCF